MTYSQANTVAISCVNGFQNASAKLNFVQIVDDADACGRMITGV